MSTTTWNLDNAHSEIMFKVKHMMITNVTGRFTEFAANVTTDGEDFTKADITFTIKAASVNTGSDQRDGHLRSPEFFEADKFADITFKSTKLEKVDDENYKLTGDLTIKNVTKSISLNAENGGVGKDPWGNIKTGFTVTGKINRKDFGLNWNAALETGGVMVSEEVRIAAEVQFVKTV